MSQMKLSYFDFDGGRAEPIRLALAYGDVPFEDHRFAVNEWPEVRSQTPLKQVPVMEVDGEIITQCNALTRYVGKLVGLYPEDTLEALHCDEVMDIVEDITCKIVPTLFMQDEKEKRIAREALAQGPITLALRRLESVLKERGGRYFAGDRLSVADFKVFLWVRNLQSGHLDYVPSDIVQQIAPALVDHCSRISAVPQVLAYYEMRAAASRGD